MEEQLDILIEHSGVAHDENPPGRGSGRYPWGGGDKPFQRPRDFLQQVKRLEAMGMTEKEQASALGIFTRDRRRQYEGSPTRLRAAIRIAQHEEKLDLIRECRTLSKEGKTPTEIAKLLNIPNESSVRGYLKEGSENRAKSAQKTADDLVKILKERGGPIEVGEGVSRQLNISEDRFKEALEILYFEGYEIHTGRVPQPNNPKHQTTTKVLCEPGTPPKAAYDYKNIHFINDQYISHDGVTIDKGFQYPASLDSSRLKIRYPSEGGDKKDGVVELRPGVKDISLGEGNHYSQVRILVDGTHYIKGMAVYGDPKDFPPGVDLIFNTSKSDGTPMKATEKDGKQVLKSIGSDPNNPFNSAIKERGGQSYWTDDKGEEHLSLINKRADEGDWEGWSKELPSQFLSKQPRAFVQRQLDISKKEAREELDTIKSLTNDTVKKILLNNFANTTDGKATDLSAASVPGQRYQVILPINSLKDNEIYAPNFKPGEQVSLVRFPHSGLFEIPTLTVVANNPEADRVITKQAGDAVGINAKVARQLSGADFDGDTVLVIPHRNGVQVSHRDYLDQLKNFDMELEYGDHPGNQIMKKEYQQKQMGVVSNLITDMTLFGAPDEELAMAVKHSMVVIDAVKHKYDWKQSEKDNHIKELTKKWQKKVNEDGTIHYGGAATIISRAGGPVTIQGEIKEGQKKIDPVTGKSLGTQYIDPETGKKLETIVDEPYRFYMTPNTRGSDGKKLSLKERRMFPIDGNPGMYRNNTGTVVLPKEALVLSPEQHRYTSVSAMTRTDDAMTLVSAMRNAKELAYADYANYLKGLANEARKETLSLRPTKYDPVANKTYAKEVQSLKDKYIQLELRKQPEKAAIMEANTMIKAWYLDNPEATKEQRGKAKQRITTMCRKARGLTGTRNSIEITPKEWEAIQAGAIGSSKLEQLLKKADMNIIQEYAMPHTRGKLTQTQKNRIKALAASGASNSEIAEALNINVSTVIRYAKGNEEDV